MTETEILELERNYSESKIQHTCVKWFRQTFPAVAKLLIAVPNGGYRPGKTGALMVYEGQVKGAPDLIFIFPSKGKATLCVEMKVPHKKGRSAGRQSDEQKAWQTAVESYGSVYIVCHGLMEFIEGVCGYLHIEPHQYKADAMRKYPLYLQK